MLSCQLGAPGYVLNVRPSRPPAAARREKASTGAPLPCVVLLSRSCDAELEAVGGLLGQAGIPAERINADELAVTDLLIDPGRRAVRCNGRWLAPTVVWNRHFSARAIEGSASPAHTMFLRDSWRAATGHLAALSPAAIGMRNPGLSDQMQVAQEQRIAVPRTVVTTDAAAAAELFGDSCDLFVKALDEHFVEASPGRLSGVFPVAVNSRQLRHAQRPGPPVIVQEYVEHDAELRVYYVDGQVHGFAVGKEAAADLWLVPDRVTVRHVELPATVVLATKALAEGLSLRYGAFDYLLQGDRLVFLEVNPHGDWLWAEAKARTAPVTRAVAQVLCELHRKYRPSLAAPGSRVADRFDLLSFLARPRRPASPGQAARALAPSRRGRGALLPIGAGHHGRNRNRGIAHHEGAARRVDRGAEPGQQLRQDGRRELAVGPQRGDDAEPLLARVRPRPVELPLLRRAEFACPADPVDRGARRRLTYGRGRQRP
jgi:hypothetical protein